MPTTFLKEPTTRKWIMEVLVVLLIFGLLAWVAWLCYNYEIKQMNKKISGQLITNMLFPF